MIVYTPGQDRPAVAVGRNIVTGRRRRSQPAQRRAASAAAQARAWRALAARRASGGARR